LLQAKLAVPVKPAAVLVTTMLDPEAACAPAPEQVLLLAVQLRACAGQGAAAVTAAGTTAASSPPPPPPQPASVKLNPNAVESAWIRGMCRNFMGRLQVEEREETAALGARQLHADRQLSACGSTLASSFFPGIAPIWDKPSRPLPDREDDAPQGGERLQCVGVFAGQSTDAMATTISKTAA
jgi:hypothetical protein